MKRTFLSDRRNFIKNISKLALSTTVLSSFTKNKNQFTFTVGTGDIMWAQTPLTYSYNALEPVIDAATMEIHYTRHAAGYAKNLTDAIKHENVNTATTSIEQLLAGISKYSVKMRNNAGGHYNHELFWRILKSPASGNNPSGKLAEVIIRDFNSIDAFKNQFNDVAKSRFGSGWAWLVITKERKLVICSTSNQDNPLMDIADTKGFPLLGLDIWEHAYYLKYQNRRADYINSWWSIVNWEYVHKRFSEF